MTRNHTPFLAAFVFLIAVFNAAAQKPNIVLIYVDDWAWNGTPVEMEKGMRNSMMKLVEMPNFERFATEGIRFSNAYGSQQCTPARASLQSGMSTARHGLSVYSGFRDYFDQRGNDIKEDGTYSMFQGLPSVSCGSRIPLDDKITSIPEVLNPLGYVCAHYGKWHLDSDPADEGYAESDGSTNNDDGKTLLTPDYLSDLDTNPKRFPELTAKATTFMERQVADEKPFYLQVSHYGMHSPNECLSSSRARFQHHPDVMAYNIANNRGKTEPDDLKTGDDPAVWLGMAYDLDQSIGAVLDKIDELGIADNTYVVISSDNGYRHLGRDVAVMENFPLHGHKWWSWEAGIRVAMLARGPGIPGNASCESTVVNYDFMPTFSEWAGADISHLHGNADPLKNIDGLSLAKAMTGETDTALDNRALHFHFPHYRYAMPHTTIIKGNYKALHFYDANYIFTNEYGGKWAGGNPTLLFDLSTDPGEYDNIADRQTSKVEELHTEMENYLTTVNARIPVENVAGTELTREGETYTLKGFDIEKWTNHVSLHAWVYDPDHRKSDEFFGPFLGRREPLSDEVSKPYGPTVSFRFPSADTVVAINSELLIEATAEGVDGARVEKVLLYKDGEVIEEKVGAPFKFPPLTLGQKGTFTFQLVAYDNNGLASRFATRDITVSDEIAVNKVPVINSLPTATPTTVVTGEQVDLSVVASDPDGDDRDLNYRWSVLGDSTGVTFTNGDQSDAEVVFETPGVYEVEILVSDIISYRQASVEITVESPKPTLTISLQNGVDKIVQGEPLIVTADADHASGIKVVRFTLDGVEHEVDGALPLYTYNFGDSLAVGTYELRVRASAESGSYRTKTMTIQVMPDDPANQRPTVSFRKPETNLINQEIGAEIIVIAESNDDDGDVEAITLTVTNDGELFHTQTSTTGTFTGILLDAAGSYMFKLVAKDNDDANSEAATLTVIVNDGVIGEDNGRSDDGDGGCGCTTTSPGTANIWLLLAVVLGLVIPTRVICFIRG